MSSFCKALLLYNAVLATLEMSGFSPGILLLPIASLNLSWMVQAAQVIGGDVSVVLGGTATLPCSLTGATESLTQISWQRNHNGNSNGHENFFAILPETTHTFNGAYDRFKFIGNFTAYNGTLQLPDVTLLDEDIYSCIFTLFPSGFFRIEISLNVLVPPVISVKDSLPLLGDEEVSLATCTAAGSRPPAEVRWFTGSLDSKVNSTTTSTLHDNGTTTTVSSLLGVPTRDINQGSVSCVVTSAALTETRRLPFTLQVYFSPTVVTITERAQNSFECVSEANPGARFTWSRADQSWPQSGVSVDGAALQLLSITAGVSGLYRCEASNLYGRSHAYLFVSSGTCTCSVCWVLFSLIVLFAIGLAAWTYYKKFRDTQSTGEATSERQQRVTQKAQSQEEAEQAELEQLQQVED